MFGRPRGYSSAPAMRDIPTLPTGPAAGSTPPPPPPPSGGYPKLTEHPVLCPATAQGPIVNGIPVGDHAHECGHPAKRPDGVIGILEHRCRHCGCTWTESTQRQAPDKSWLEMERS